MHLTNVGFSLKKQKTKVSIYNFNVDGFFFHYRYNSMHYIENDASNTVTNVNMLLDNICNSDSGTT